MEKIKIKGLARMAGWMFYAWGGLVAFKGLYDAFFGEPEANLYSPEKWQFVTQRQWARWSGFEMAYGLACVGLGLACWVAAKRLPDWTLRPKSSPDPDFS